MRHEGQEGRPNAVFGVNDLRGSRATCARAAFLVPLLLPLLFLLVPLLAPQAAMAVGWEATSTTFPTNLPQPVNEVQEVAVTKGEFILGFEGQYTEFMPFEAPDSAVQAALEALSSIGAGNVSVTGGPQAGAGKPYLVAFTGRLGARQLPAFEAFGEAVTAVIKTNGN